MKSNELIIVPADFANLSGSLFMDASYYFNNPETKDRMKRVLLDSGDVVEVDENKEVRKADVVFNSDNNYSYRINLDKKGYDVKALIRFVAEHPEMADSTGIKPLALGGVRRFLYTITSESVNNDYETDKSKSEVYTSYNLLNRAEKESVAIYFGVSPFEFDDKELTNAMVGFTSGNISCDATRREEFITRRDTIFDPKVLNFKSALLANLIVRSVDNVLLYQGQVLGSSEEQAIATILKRDDLYSLICRDLKGQGKLIETAAQRKENKLVEENKIKVDKKDKEFSNLGIPKGEFAKA